MTKQELVELASQSSPQKMEKTAAMMFLTEKLSPEYAAECAAEFNQILDAAEGGLNKLASKKETARAIGIAAAGTTAAALGTAIASDLYDAAKRGLTASSNFNAIVRANPSLLENHSKADLRRAFNTLHRYAPEMTADPNMGGQILAIGARSPESIHNLAKELVSVRKSIVDTKRKQFEPRYNIKTS